jgi:terminase large subunit-like protein
VDQVDDTYIRAMLELAVEQYQVPTFNVESFLFKEQLAFIRDPAKFATAVCSVRAGKTVACAADLIDTALTKPGTTGLYITLTRSSARKIVWPELHRINNEFNLGGQPNETDLSFKFYNESLIYCSGAQDATEIEKFRGLSNVAVAYLDESQAFRAHIKELVEDILIKRLYDTNGRLRLIGTPGPIPAGYFYDASHSAKWAHHAWTLHSNPWLYAKSGVTIEQIIQQDCDLKGVTIDDPSIQRECFGRWVLDSNSLLLNYSPEINHFETLPEGKWKYILGMDFGYDDADSFSILAFNDKSPNTYLVEEVINHNHTYEQMAHEVDKIFKKYDICRVVADPGGGGKKLIESLKQRYPIPMEPADKLGKIANYGLLNNSLRTGRFFAKKDSRFAQDCNLLERDKDKSTPDKTIVKGHSDAVDSCLYAFRESPAYYYKAPPPEPKKGSKESEDKIAQDIFEHNRNRLERERQMKDGSGFGSWESDRFGEPSWTKWE